jgi:putative mRNA 3-end processing factor
VPGRSDLLRITDRGLYCEAGDFHVDPWKPVDRAVITHGHGDHARFGSKDYVCSTDSAPVLRLRLGEEARIEALPYGEERRLGDARISLHPAGHILGSAQVRIEHRGEIWVVTGDYKTEPDPSCTAFELVRCHTLVTESTFALPVYHWPDHADVMEKVHAWWRANQEQGRASILFAYALGKAQRLLSGLDPSTGPIFAHGAVERMNGVYRNAGVALPPCGYATGARNADFSRALILAPPGAGNSGWLRRFGDASLAFASGWMLIRGQRRRRSVDRGFVVSDHADWDGLLTVVRESGAERVLPTHGYTDQFARWLRENGLDATPLPTRFIGEGRGEEDEPVADEVEG